MLDKASIAIGERELDFHFRPDSRGDTGVLHQIFVDEDYAVEMWPQGRALSDFYNSLLPGKTPLIVDAGANIGASAVYFLGKYSKSFVFSIEPNLENWELLEANTSTFRDKTNFRGALSSTVGTVAVVDPGESDWGYRTTQDISNLSPGHLVETITPMQILAKDLHGDKTPFIFKIDIEGGEEDLFADDTDWMDRFPLIIIELHDWMLPFSGSSRHFIRALARFDFDVLQKGENLFLFNRGLLSSFTS